MEAASRQEIFRGHLDECLRHITQQKDTEMRVLLMNFCKISRNTIDRWLRGSSIPEGINLIKAICFLHMRGYTIIEWRNMKPAHRVFAELMGFGVMSPEEA